MQGVSQALRRPYTLAVGQPVRCSVSIRDIPVGKLMRERRAPMNNDLELIDPNKLSVNCEHRGVAATTFGRGESATPER
jgi:hypothetical protein